MYLVYPPTPHRDVERLHLLFNQITPERVGHWTFATLRPEAAGVWPEVENVVGQVSFTFERR